jgi:hypothetical protein
MASETALKSDRSSARAEKRIAELHEARLGLTPPDETELLLVGLSDDQVAERNRLGLNNAYDPGTSRSLGSILRGNILTLFNAVIFA